MSFYRIAVLSFFVFFCFFFNDTATTEIYTLSLHDALPIYHEFDAPDPGFLKGKRISMDINALTIGLVIDYSIMHYFGNPRHTQSMIA